MTFIIACALLAAAMISPATSATTKRLLWLAADFLFSVTVELVVLLLRHADWLESMVRR